MTQQAYNIQQAAQVYGVSPDVIRAHIRKGNLVPRYPSSRPVLDAQDLKEWFESLPTEHTA